jgi:hypothetical protein
MKPGITSRTEIVCNDDCSVTITLANSCQPIENRIPTNKSEDFFVCFRAYAPKEEFFDRSWQLNEINKLN